MKRLFLAIALFCSFGVGSASADIWGNIAKAVGKAWEDIKRETTNALKNVTFSSNYNGEINGDGNVKTELKVNL